MSLVLHQFILEATKQKVAETCVSTTFERTHVCRWIMTAIWAKQARKATANGIAEAEKAIRAMNEC